MMPCQDSNPRAVNRKSDALPIAQPRRLIVLNRDEICQSLKLQLSAAGSGMGLGAKPHTKCRLASSVKQTGH